MKAKKLVWVIAVAVIFSFAFPVHAVAKDTVDKATQVDKETQTQQSAPMPMMSGAPQEMMQQCMAMMQKDSETSAMMQRCQLMMRTPIFMDSPCAIYGQAEPLKLSEEQKKMLTDIENEARKKALAVLTDEQKKKMGDISEQPMAMVQMCQQMCSKMMPMMQKMMSGEGKTGPMMMCPMMQMMNEKMEEPNTQMKEKMDKAAEKAMPEQTVCPVSGKPINKQYSTIYKGKTVYFCCPACKPEFEKSPEKYIGNLPQFKQ